MACCGCAEKAAGALTGAEKGHVHDLALWQVLNGVHVALCAKEQGALGSSIGLR
jgi:hypothetical protein